MRAWAPCRGRPGLGRSVPTSRRNSTSPSASAPCFPSSNRGHAGPSRPPVKTLDHPSPSPGSKGPPRGSRRSSAAKLRPSSSGLCFLIVFPGVLVDVPVPERAGLRRRRSWACAGEARLSEMCPEGGQVPVSGSEPRKFRRRDARRRNRLESATGGPRRPRSHSHRRARRGRPENPWLSAGSLVRP